jgi:hypothetical protein
MTYSILYEFKTDLLTDVTSCSSILHVSSLGFFEKLKADVLVDCY